MRVIYSTDIGDVSEWVCPEHTGWAFTRFIRWWSARTPVPGFPSSVEQAVQLANAHAIATPKKLVLEKKSGEKFYSIKKAVFERETEYCS